MTGTSLRRTACLLAVAGMGLMFAPPAGPAPVRGCPVPEALYAHEPVLPKTLRALAGGGEVMIVAIGGASTLGRAAGGAELTWPARLAEALAGRFPSLRVRVINFGVPRQTAQEMADRLDRDVLPLKPVLVIWESGTMEAVRGTSLDDFRNTLEAGLYRLRAAGVDVVLMDMQFSRRTNVMINFEPYLAVIREVADAADVPLFRRYDIMRHWAENEMINLRPSTREKRRLAAASLYDCLGRAMAGFMARGTSVPKPGPGPGGGR